MCLPHISTAHCRSILRQLAFSPGGGLCLLRNYFARISPFSFQYVLAYKIGSPFPIFFVWLAPCIYAACMHHLQWSSLANVEPTSTPGSGARVHLCLQANAARNAARKRSTCAVCTFVYLCLQAKCSKEISRQLTATTPQI